MNQPVRSPEPITSDAGIKLVLWPDGTWCWHDDYRASDYTHMSDDFEIVDMADMPAVARLAAEHPAVRGEIRAETGGTAI